MKSILFVSSTSLGSNPRMVKEIELAQRFYKCTVLCFRLGNWSDCLDMEIAQRFPNINFIFIGADRRDFWNWGVSSISEKVARKLQVFLPSNLLLNALAHSKRSWLLLMKLSNLEYHDLVVAHNLAALYPAFYFSKRFSTRYAFDIEDYHPGEFIGNNIQQERDRRILLLKRILPSACYLSAASELIGDCTIRDAGLDKYTNKAFHLIPNSFNSTEFALPKSLKGFTKLKIVWFSQYITSNRGLEELLEALDPIRDLVELHLIGDVKPHFQDIIYAKRDLVHIHAPISQIALHHFLSSFDVGLALEISKVDKNKDLAVSNKIYAYAQAGLHILATDTKGQSWFIESYPWCGNLTEQTAEAIKASVLKLIINKEQLRIRARARFEKSKELAWEKESYKLIEVWKSI